jgi:tape measure domain-containing protein
MQFDNKHFESNVKTTMSTLDKLKQSLKFDKASKGMDGVAAAARKCDISPLGKAAETVNAKFSAMEVIGVTALANITNSAVNYGKRIVSALTIDPIKTGFSEYETKINAIQTIMSNTASKGTTMDDVTKALGDLNTYADKTIYNFAEMTRNIGTFTAAGNGLDESVKAIKGIANLAAASGSTSQQASTAMYQLSQALSSGTVKLMDWNSVVNAGMGGEKFQEALKATARDHGVAVDKMIDKAGSFRESLSEGWITADILNETLSKFTEEGAAEYSKAMMESGKWTQEQADALMAEAKAMTEAATKVKTFTQLCDTMKETAQSGWSQTWELIFGDFEEAKDFFSGVGDSIGGFLDNMSDYRNSMIGDALNSKYDKFLQLVNEAGVSTDDYNTRLIDVAAKHGVEIDNLIEKHGSLNNVVAKGLVPTEMFSEALSGLASEAGVSAEGIEKANTYVVRSWEEYGDCLSTIAERYGTTWQELYRLNKDIIGDNPNIIHTGQILKLSDAQLKSNGYTEEQIKLLRDLEKQSKETGTPIKELVEAMGKPSGRQMLFAAAKDMIASVLDVLNAIGKALDNVFPKEEASAGIFNAVEGIYNFTSGIRDLLENTDTLDKLTRTFQGLFAIIDIISTLVGGAFKTAFRIIAKVLGVANIDVLGFTAGIGDALVGLRDFIDGLLNFDAVIDPVANGIKKAIDAVKAWIETLKTAYKTGGAKGLADNLFGGIESGVKSIGKWFTNLGSTVVNGLKSIPEYIGSGFVGGLLNSAKKVYDTIIEFGKNIIVKICDVLGIESPSTVFFAIGGFIIAGLLGGLSAAFPQVGEFFANAGTKISEAFSDFDFSKLVAVLGAGGLILTVKKFGDVLGAIASPIEGIGDVLSGVGSVLTKSARSISKVIKASAKVVNNFAKSIKKIGYAIADNIKARSLSIRADALMTIAKAILVLVASLVVLSLIPVENLIKAGIALAVVVGAIIAIIKVLDSTKKGTIDTALFTGMVMSLAAALLILAIAAKMFAGLSWEGLAKAGAAFIVIGGLMVGLMAATKLVSKTEKGNMSTGLEHVGRMMIKIAASMLILAISAKIFASMSWEDLGKAGAAMVVLAGVMVGLMAATKLIAKTDKGNISSGIATMGNTIMKIAGSMLILAIAAKIFATMTWEDLGKAGAALLALAGMMVGLTAASKLVGKGQNVGQIGKMLMSIAGALLILSITAKIIAGMTWEEMGKAGAGILALSGIITGLIAATRLVGGKDLGKLGGVLMGVAAVMFVLAIVGKIIAGMTWEDMGKAGVGLLALGGIITGLIAATRLAGGNDLKRVPSTLLVMSIAIGILAGIALLLSLMSWEGLAKGIGAVSVLAGMMALLIAATKNAQQCKDELIAMTIAIAVMAGAVALLSMIDGQKLAIATGALSTVIGMFALMILASSKASKSIGSLIVMTLAVGLMGQMLYQLSQLPVEKTIGSAVALSVLIAALSVMLVALSAAGKIGGSALKGAGALAVAMVALAALVGVLYLMQDIKVAHGNVLFLVGLATAMTLLLIPLTIIGNFGKSALMGVLALTAMAIPLLAFVGVLALMQNIQAAHTNATLLIGMATAMTLLLIPLTLIGFLGATAFVGVLALTAMAVPLLAFVGVLALMQNIQNATANTMLLIDLMETLSDILVKIAIIAPLAVIGVAALTALTGLMTALGVMAVAIGALMTKFPQLEEFLNKGLPLLEQLAGSLGTMIGNFVAGFATAITAALPGIGLSLSEFMMNAMPFITGAKLVDESVLKGVGILAASVLALTAADIVEGIGSFLSGGTSFASLGTELSMFMTNALPFIMGARSIDPTAMKGVKTLAEALMIITAADLVEGLTSWLTGGSSLGDFGKQLGPFGEGIAAFSNAVAGIDNASVKVAAEAGKNLAQMAKEMPNSGGWLGKIFGENDADSFGEQMKSFGSSLAAFSDAVDGGAVNKEAISNAVDSAKMLVEMSKEMPNSGGWLGKIIGDNDADSFGEQMKSFGLSLAAFSDAVDNGAVNSEAVAAAIESANKLVEFSKTIPNSGGLLGNIIGNNDADAFGAKMNAFGTSLSDFSTSIAGGIDLDAIDAFATAFTKLAGSGIDSFVESFSAGMPEVDTVISTMIQRIITQLRLHTPTIQTTIASVIKSGATRIRTGYTDFYSAGAFLVQGFANGISANAYKATARARAMALSALMAAKTALGINSPSKEFYKVGMGTIEGFVKAVDENSNQASKATTSMADKLKASFKNAMSKVNDLLSSDLDSQPTIRPVLDLSDVTAGAKSIGGMFNSPTLAMANVGAISHMSAQRQNGVGNSDLLSAIKDLGSKMGTVGNTYSINGINVSEGTEAADVIHSLVRVMKMEGRS